MPGWGFNIPTTNKPIQFNTSLEVSDESLRTRKKEQTLCNRSELFAFLMNKTQHSFTDLLNAETFREYFLTADFLVVAEILFFLPLARGLFFNSLTLLK